MARLNIDTPPIIGNELPDDLNKWFANIIDQINFNLNNVVSERSANIGGGGAGPIAVSVYGMTADSIITANIHSSTNAVSVQKVTAVSGGFTVLFSGDPGASCLLNYTVYIQPWASQGV